MAGITKSQGKALLEIARKAIEEALKHKTVKVQPAVRSGLSSHHAVFVTLLKDGELRGSMGYPSVSYPLIDGVVRAARDAAFEDPRFKPVTRTELPKLRIRIDVLSKFTPARASSIKPGTGAYIEYGPFLAMLLPEDSRQFKWAGREIVQNALRKAGLAPEMWKDRNVKVYRFTTKAFMEKATS